MTTTKVSPSSMACKTCHRSVPEVEFYASIATYCKTHWRERVKANRAVNADYYRAFDRARANLPHRVSARKDYMQTDAGKDSHNKANRRYSDKYPERTQARTTLGNAVRDGKVLPMPCLVCGNDAEAHHPDYSHPLDVIWLCDAHHKEVHAMTKQLKAA